MSRGYVLRARLDELEAFLLRVELGARGWNVSQTARALGMSRKGLQLKIAEYGLTAPPSARQGATPATLHATGCNTLQGPAARHGARVSAGTV